MFVAVPILIAVLGHFLGPALGVWLASQGLGTLGAGVVEAAIEAAAEPLLEKAIETIPHGPLTPAEQQTQQANLLRNRYDLAGPMG